MMFLDCEFDGFGGELISMAIVASNGDEFYEVLHAQPSDKWVIENVMPKLGKEPITDMIFQNQLHRFLQKHVGEVIVADSPADFKYLLEWLEWLTSEKKYHYLNLEVKMQFTPSGEYTSDTPHNALSDARALKKWYLSTVHQRLPNGNDVRKDA